MSSRSVSRRSPPTRWNVVSAARVGWREQGVWRAASKALPTVRRALAHGELSWCAAELVARAAEPGQEGCWLAAGRTHTVPQVRLLVREAELSRKDEEEGEGGGALSQPPADPEEAEGEALCTLTCTVDRED